MENNKYKRDKLPKGILGLAIFILLISFLYWRLPVTVPETQAPSNAIAAHESTKATKPVAEKKSPTKAKKADYVKNELIVKFSPHTSDSRRKHSLNKIGASIKETFRNDKDLVVLLLAKDMSVEDAQSFFKKTDIVRFAEPNYIYQTSEVPNDPLFSQLWGLENIGQDNGIEGIDIRAVDAWDIHTGSRDVVIGVIDTGVDYLHPDLQSNIWTNPNEIPDNNIDDDGNGWIDDIHGINTVNDNGNPMDDNGHGTHVAGTIAASGDDGEGVVGVMWQASIVACKFLDASGFGDLADALQCMDYFSSLRRDNINLIATNNSWGGGGYSEGLFEAIEDHGNKNVLFVAAAGNYSSNNDRFPTYPASYELDNVISVAAIDRTGELADFSNYGVESVDIAAPGVDIHSTVPGETWDTYSGTSMASPHVAGMLGLIKSKIPELNASELKDYLLEHSVSEENLQDIIVNGKRAVLELPFIDEDEDLMSDEWEIEFGLDPSDPNDANGDLDNDGLINLDEFIHGTSPVVIDTDNDGLSDGDEVNVYNTDPLSSDSDEDGLSDIDEINTYGTNPNSADSDGDGITDGDEIEEYSTDPLAADTDGDGIDDGWEVQYEMNPNSSADALLDTDEDGLTNHEEFLAGSSPLLNDSDGDGLSDADEVNLHNTDPGSKDSDGDGMSDAWELQYAFNPNDSSDANNDADRDGYSNLLEFHAGTDPLGDSSFPLLSPWTNYQGNAELNAWSLMSTDSDNFSLRWSSIDSHMQTWRRYVNANGRFYALTTSDFSHYSLKAFSSLDGNEIWSRDFVNMSDVSDFAHDNQNLYLSTQGLGIEASSFVALDLATGEIQLNAPAPELTSWGQPIVHDGAAYMTGTYLLVKKDVITGETLWTTEQDAHYLRHPPAIYGDQLIRTSAIELLFISQATGNIENRIPYPDECRTSISGGSVALQENTAISFSSRCVMFYDLEDGRLLWHRTLENTNSVVIAADQVLVMTGDALLSLRVEDGSTQWDWSPEYGYLTGNMVVTLNHAFLAGYDDTYAVNLETHESDWSFPSSGPLSLTDDGALLIQSYRSTFAINIEGDTDGDGLPDWWERRYQLLIADPSDASIDSDEDGLTNLEEYNLGTSPISSDSDGDNLSDSAEHNTHGTNPSDSDSDNDGLNDGEEINQYQTNPMDLDSDDDQISDGDEVNQYGTDPNDNSSVPALLTDFRYSFEEGIPEAWFSPEMSNADWQVSTQHSSHGGQSLRSGEIENNQNSSITWTGLFANGELVFDAYVSAESCCDVLSFYVDDQLKYTQRSNESWQSIRVNIDAGEHTLRWTYEKDYIIGAGEDAAYIDNIRYQVPGPFASNGNNILLATSGSLMEFSSRGDLVRSNMELRHTVGVKDLVLTHEHKIAFADAPWLHLFDPNTGIMTTQRIEQWRPCCGNIGDKIHADENGIWLSTNESPEGLIHLNHQAEFIKQIAPDNKYQDIDSLGDEIFALSTAGNRVDVIHADSGEILRSINLDEGFVQSVAIASDGNLYALQEGWIYLYGADGSVLNSMDTGFYTSDLIEIDLDAQRSRLLVGAYGGYASVSLDLTSIEFFPVPVVNAYNSRAVYVSPVDLGGVDQDSDGIPDWWERVHQLNPSDGSDAQEDFDNDGLNNLAEFIAQSNPNIADSDGDGLTDGEEVNQHQSDPTQVDSDGDGISDYDEVEQYETSPNVIDSDGDGLSDGDEILHHQTDPTNADSDADGISDGYEIENGLNPNDATDAVLDLDNDGLSAAEEFLAGSNPGISDSDYDGLTDGDEVNTHNTDPVNEDSDGDRLTDGWEVRFNFNPLVMNSDQQDSDGDGISDFKEYYGDSDPTDSSLVPQMREWHQHGGNSRHTAYVPVTLDETSFRHSWTFENENSSLEVQNAAVISNGHAAYFWVYDFESYSYRNYRVDTRSGEEVWRLDLDTELQSAAVFNNDFLYFSSGGWWEPSTLRVVDTSTGELFDEQSIERYRFDNFPFATFENELYIPGMINNSPHLFSFGVDDLQENWTSSTEYFVGWAPAIDEEGVYSYSNGIARRLNHLDGSVEISRSAPVPRESSYFGGAPVKGSGNWLHIANSGVVRSVNLASGVVNNLTNTSEYYLTEIAYSNGQVFTQYDDSLIVFDEVTGDELWRWSSDREVLRFNIVVTDSHAFVSSHNITYAISLDTQSEVWRYDTGGHLSLSRYGKLFIASRSQGIVAIDVVPDSDGDNMPDWWELQHGLNSNDAGDATADRDNDGLSNFDEFSEGADPNLEDTDGDGLLDGQEVLTFLTNPTKADTDNDMLDDGEELNIYQTDPLDRDSDDDRLEDGDEVNLYQTDPSVADSDSDGVIDGREVERGTDPNDPNSVPEIFTELFHDFNDDTLPFGDWIRPEVANEGWLVGPGGEDGSMAFSSGDIEDLQVAEMLWQIDFIAGTIEFDYRVSSEHGYDYFNLFVNGINVFEASGEEGWQRQSIEIPEEGGYEILWQYRKDGSVSLGEDRVLIDNLQFKALDSDGDGMPDFWEDRYGFTTVLATDASEDADGDGFTNLQEYQQNTDPTNADSRPAADPTPADTPVPSQNASSSGGGGGGGGAGIGLLLLCVGLLFMRRPVLVRVY